MKKSVRTALIVTAGLILAVLVFAAIQRLLIPKYQTGTVEGSMIEEYYDAKEPHEILILGDCEVFENISPVALYSEYGLSSYIRGSAEQYIWQSYYLLEDTLRYETPKVVVLSVHSLQFDQPRKEEYNRMTLDGMRWSGTKIEAIKASMLPEEKFVDYVFPILRYHYRWSELGSDDFTHFASKDKVSHNGYYMRCDVKPYEGFPPAFPLADYTLGSNAMGYLNRIIDLCEAKGIKLVLFKAPIEYPSWYTQWDEQIQKVADSRGIPYINLIGNDDIGLDMSVDTYDAGLHLNLTGAEKLSSYLGNWLISRYTLTDFRQDAETSAAWEEKISYYNAMRDRQMSEIEQYGHLVSFGASAIN
ncbi:hypothetical protein SAMN02910456_02572 [Ruminococcaceae bacterium YRB3002]|nr:hypothetical protein SAMN02910456_02572 [Ruminococcaceae bacterium YRB3002]